MNLGKFSIIVKPIFDFQEPHKHMTHFLLAMAYNGVTQKVQGRKSKQKPS